MGRENLKMSQGKKKLACDRSRENPEMGQEKRGRNMTTINEIGIRVKKNEIE